MSLANHMLARCFLKDHKRWKPLGRSGQQEGWSVTSPSYSNQWRTQEFFSGRGSTNSIEDRGQEDGDLGAVAP